MQFFDVLFNSLCSIKIHKKYLIRNISFIDVDYRLVCESKTKCYLHKSSKAMVCVFSTIVIQVKNLNCDANNCELRKASGLTTWWC